MRHELHEENPEGVNTDGDRDRVDDGGEEHHRRVAVEELAHAEIRVDAGGERENRGCDFQRHFQALQTGGELHGRPRKDGGGAFEHDSSLRRRLKPASAIGPGFTWKVISWTRFRPYCVRA